MSTDPRARVALWAGLGGVLAGVLLVLGLLAVGSALKGVPATAATGAEPRLGVDADLLDGFHGNEIVRLAGVQTSDAKDLAASTRFSRVLTKQIVAPRYGYVIVDAVQEVRGSIEDTWVDLTCRLLVCPVSTCGLGNSPYEVKGSRQRLAFDVVEGGSNPQDFSMQVVSHGFIKVGPGTIGGTTYNVDLQCKSLRDVDFGHGSLTALFVPFGSNGAPATP